jgi:hypothetical protein
MSVAYSLGRSRTTMPSRKSVYSGLCHFLYCVVKLAQAPGFCPDAGGAVRLNKKTNLRTMLNSIRFVTLLIHFVLIVPTSLVVTSSPRASSNRAAAAEQRIHIDPPGPNDSRYAYVPFDVPPGAQRIKVSYQYDRARDTNTIDIGIFDARFSGHDTDPRGFRGWSGGRRSEVFISREAATPGYLRGPLSPGKWRVIFGLYRVAPGGVDIALKIEIETKKNGLSNTNPVTNETRPSSLDRSTARIPLRIKPQPYASAPGVAGSGTRWWRGDLHMHTVHSDGNWTIPELISSARNTGLDFIVITDHNTASHHEEIDRLTRGAHQPLVMRGEEITTYGGHTNAWGLPSGTWIDFRTHPGDTKRISSLAAAAHRAGALISINHPFVLCGGCAWSYDAEARGFDAIEVWNGPWDFTDEPAVKMWDAILQSGRRITAIASSDSHRPDAPIGKPATHVAARVLSQATLLAAIRAGHAYLSDGAPRFAIMFEAEAVRLRHRPRAIIGDEIHLNEPGKIRFLITTEATPDRATVSLISNGEVIKNFPARTDGQPQVVEIDCRDNSYFRIEVRDAKNTMLALTNPIYVRLQRH